MELIYKRKKIDIIIDSTYSLNSTDNTSNSLKIYNPYKLVANDYYSLMIISIDGMNLFGFLGIGTMSSVDKAVVDNDCLLILVSDYVVKINMNNYDILLITPVICTSEIFGIYKIKEGFILYGEMEIIMLDKKLTKKWSFIGKDIFVTIKDETPFQIFNDRIRLVDFLGNHYSLDFDGKGVIVD